MRVLVVANGKGGVGKTTTALALSCLLAEQWQVVAVDADPQGSFSLVAERYEGEEWDLVQETEPGQLTKLRKLKADWLVCDTPPALRDEGLKAILKAADFVILPCQSEYLDLMALAETIRSVVIPSGVRYRVLLTRVDPRRANAALDAQNWLQEQGASTFNAVIRSYAAHSAAMVAGVPIYRFRGDRNAGIAAADYRKVLEELLRECC